MSIGTNLVLQERIRQKELFPDDSKHVDKELTLEADSLLKTYNDRKDLTTENSKRLLVKSAAMIVAEIDRITEAEYPPDCEYHGEF